MKKYKLFTSIILIIIMSVLSFYLYIGYQFGKATNEASKHIIEIQKEWKNKNINPLDTIMRNLNKVLDSTNSIKTKK